MCIRDSCKTCRHNNCAIVKRYVFQNWNLSWDPTDWIDFVLNFRRKITLFSLFVSLKIGKISINHIQKLMNERNIFVIMRYKTMKQIISDYLQIYMILSYCIISDISVVSSVFAVSLPIPATYDVFFFIHYKD